MKKILSMLFVGSLCLALIGCGGKGSNKNDVYEGYVKQIEEKITQADLEDAYNLCNEALAAELSEEQAAHIREQKDLVLAICYPGTFVARPEFLSDVEPVEVGEASYFTVGMLKEYDEVFCRYSFDKKSERDLAAEKYKEYLNSKYEMVDLAAKNGYVMYYYADSKGNSLAIQVMDEATGRDQLYDYVIFLDKDLYQTDRIDMRLNSTSLLEVEYVNE